MNIVYSSSDAYAECTGVSLWSLYENNKDIDNLDVYILDTDISQKNKDRIEEVAFSFGRKVTFISAKDGFIKGAEDLSLPLMRGSYNTYSRVLMNTWFNNFDRVFVIDSDTLICGSIAEIQNVKMEGMLIGAVPEVAMYGKFNNLEDKEILDNIPMYYNMGMCLINLKEWREKNIDAYIREKIIKEKPLLRIADQSIVNKYLSSYIVRLNLKYNYYSVVHGIKYGTIRKVFARKEVFSKLEYEMAAEQPVVIHYFGHSFERPWFNHNAAYKKGDYLKIREKTPWKDQPLQQWRKPESRVLRAYDMFSYILLRLGLRGFALKLRYIYGQRIKGATGIHR
jgi:lipopolysaccharide biosynthesis glycosyltransferase